MKFPAVRLRARHTRAVAALAAAASVASLVVLSIDVGYPSSRVQLRAGTAWLASTQIGQVTLVDGASAQVATQVPVAAPGSPLNVAQQGSAAYVLNRTDGTLARVDGATQRVSHRATAIPGARDALTIMPATHTLYTIDTHSGMLASADLETLTPQGNPQRLEAGIAPGGSVVSGRGHLWAIEQHTGELVWLAGGQRRTRAAAALPGAPRLTATQGQPALVDPARSTAELLNPDTGTVTRSARPDIQPGDAVTASGSSNRSRILLSVAARGVFIMCTFDTASCTAPLTIGSSRSNLGAPVEVGNFAVVPDYASGMASIVDLTAMRLVAQRQLFDHPARFELFTRDGIVFFNDPDSSRAGVLDLAGNVRVITKYDEVKSGDGAAPAPNQATEAGHPSSADRQNPSNPGPGSGSVKSGPGIPRPSRAPAPPSSEGPRSSVSIVVKPSNHGLVGQQFELSLISRLSAGIAQTHWRFGDGTEATGTTVHHRWDRPGTFPVTAAVTLTTGEKAPIAETKVVVDPAGAAPRIERLTIRRATPVIGEKVRFSADITGSRPEKWNWTISARHLPGGRITATTPEFHHVFTTPGAYTISLIVTAGANSASASHNLTVALGDVKAWGDNGSNQVAVPLEANHGVVAVAAGSRHSLALRADGSVVGWGNDDFGQATGPWEADGVVPIAAGNLHSLALKADGSVVGWGNDELGQISVPLQAKHGVTAIAAGNVHSLALRNDGSVIAWGRNSHGQGEAPLEATGVVAVAAGSTHNLALKNDGAVIGWGNDEFGQAAVPVEAKQGVTAIAAGCMHSLALKDDGSVFAWGDNGFNQLSVPVEAKRGVTAIAAGCTHSLALKDDGSVIAWGDNGSNQLAVPREATRGVTAIAAGGVHSLAS